MLRPLAFAVDSARDIGLLGLGGALVALAAADEALAFSLLCGALWAAANLLALSWLLYLVVQGKRSRRLFIFPIACAKLPASYFLLWWLIRVDYTEPLGVAIGICLMPPVLLARGLYLFRQSDTHPDANKEGR